MAHKKKRGVQLTVYHSPKPVLHGTQGTGAMPAAIRTISKVPKKVAKQLHSATQRAANAVKQNAAEPVRAGIGMATGNAAGFLARQGVKAAAKKSTAVGNHQAITHLALAAVGLGVGIAGSLTKHKTLMHAGEHFLSFNIGAATVLGEDGTAASSKKDTSGPFEGGARMDRVQRRRAMASALADQIRREDPQLTEGDDSLEEHVGELVDDVAEEVEGAAGALDEDGTGFLPFLALPALAKAIGTLKSTKTPDGQAQLQKKTTDGETPGIDALLAFEGYDTDQMDTGAKGREAKKIRKLKKKQRKLERKQRRKIAEQWIKSGSLVWRMDKVNANIDNLRQRMNDLSAKVDSQAQAAAPLETVMPGEDPFGAPSEEDVLVVPSPDETADILSGRMPNYATIRFE